MQRGVVGAEDDLAWWINHKEGSTECQRFSFTSWSNSCGTTTCSKTVLASSSSNSGGGGIGGIGGIGGGSSSSSSAAGRRRRHRTSAGKPHQRRGERMPLPLRGEKARWGERLHLHAW